MSWKEKIFEDTLTNIVRHYEGNMTADPAVPSSSLPRNSIVSGFV